MTTKRGIATAFLALVSLALPAFTQQSKVVTKGPYVVKEAKHDSGPLLREIAPLLPEFSSPSEHEIENPPNPNHNWNKEYRPDPVLQTPENSPTLETPSSSLEFDGLGYGDSFFCNCMPADNDGAAGTTQYTEYVNTFYAVYDKSGNTLLGPVAGNSFWSGFGTPCQLDNSGDTIIRFDAMAQRWVASQFAINSAGDDYECVAVSQTDDATGAYNRYAFKFADFPDYPKMGVWPDGYYFTFNNFNLSGSAFVGANACAADRDSMLSGGPANLVCFQQNSNQFGELPGDLDGITQPAPGTPNFVVELDPDGSANLDMFQFHVDFNTPSNSTFTGPTLIPVPAFTPSCASTSRNACAPQPDPGSDLLETLSDRLMYRLVYRNFGDHTVLLTSHTVQAGSQSGVRWYEIHNPETSPTVYQSGTFSPDSQYRFMPSVAMDQSQDIAVGYTRSGSGSGQYPSLLYAGRVPSDALGTLESEVVMKAGTGSQSSGGADRWGDYTSMTVDPTDDCTFWFTESYIKTTGQNGGFNWSTAIGSFVFPGCTGTPAFSLTSNPTALSVAPGSTGKSTITVVPINGFTGSVTFAASGLPTGVTAAFSPASSTTGSTVTFTASASAPGGTATVTITGTSGSVTNITTIALTVTGASANFSLTANPTSVSVAQGGTGTSTITVVPSGGFTGSVTLSASGLPSGVTAGFAPNPTTSTSTLTFTASSTATTGTSSVTVTGKSGSLTNTTTVSLTVTSSGGGPAVTLSPTSITFANTVVGATSSSKTVTLTNSGTGTLNISGITTTGDFAVAANSAKNACGATVAAGASCTVKVTFTPTQVGTRTGSLQFTDNAPGSPQSVALSGTGLAQATLTPASATFHTEPVGTPSPAKTFTLSNKQSVSLTSISITTSGDFSVSTTTCGSSLGAKSTCTISVVFTPTQTGTRTGTLQVSDSAVGSPQTSSLSGTGK